MASKCVHKGCGKLFTDADERCHYHPGPPEFHEGQKGWKCCKPRVLTFDEFLHIPPCTTGTHSTIDDTPAPKESKPNDEEIEAKIRQQNERAAIAQPAVARIAVSSQPPRATPSPAPPPEDEDDDPSLPIPENATCRRRGCGATYSNTTNSNREGEECTYHPGQALFHEGSKGWTCCKKRVLEFDEFMKIPGCKTKAQHLFVGRKKDAAKEEELDDIRSDFYQTATTVIASLYLKKIDKDRSKVEYREDGKTVDLDLHTSDHKHFSKSLELFGAIKPAESLFKIMGTKLELTLAKADGVGWPVLRATDPHTGEIIQAGRAGKV